MATYGGSDFTGFRGVSLLNSIAIRLWTGSAAGTLRADLSEGVDRAWTFPNKSGTFPISGTFTVNVPAISANSVHSTNVTVSGIRAEDAIVATLQDTFATIGTTNWAVRGFPFLGGVSAANGGVHVTFANPTATATVYRDVVIAYTAVR